MRAEGDEGRFDKCGGSCCALGSGRLSRLGRRALEKEALAFGYARRVGLTVHLLAMELCAQRILLSYGSCIVEFGLACHFVDYGIECPTI